MLWPWQRLQACFFLAARAILPPPMKPSRQTNPAGRRARGPQTARFFHPPVAAHYRSDRQPRKAVCQRGHGKGPGAKHQAVFDLRVLRSAGPGKFRPREQLRACYELANFLTGDELNAAKTVAYLPQSIQGHAVLVVMACDDIIMAPDATIGPAGIDKSQISETIRAAYREIAGRRRN